MGEVYRARDTRLDRDVAIKVLPDALTRDPDRVARFEREAKVLASLNHPNIGAIHGFESADGRTFLVLEFVEGTTLADRLKRGALPLEEALEVARQIAEALEAAHEKGIVHRDLKPGNVMLRFDGTVKVLDFGLARAMADESTVVRAMPDSPTVTTPVVAASPTMPGVILGTAGYMSPEQARGRPVDKRSDIFSFGCVLYEMLTGVQPFVGETVTDSLGAILHREPNWALLPASAPLRIRDLLRTCLTKDLKRRLHDAADARIAIENSGEEEAAAPLPSRRSRTWVVGALATAVCAFLVTEAWIRMSARVHSPAPVVRSAIDFSPLSLGEPGIAPLALSPDGRTLALVAGPPGEPAQLWIRPLSSLVAQPLPGTEDAIHPFWSPDSKHIAFFSKGKLRRVPAAGGAVAVVCDAEGPRGGSWSIDNSIVFAPEPFGPLFRVPASGGTAKAVTAVTEEQETHRLPCFLPDGRRLLYTKGHVALDKEFGEIRLLDLDSGRSTSIIAEASLGLYAHPGHLIFVRGTNLMAQPIDPTSAELLGDAVVLAEDADFARSRLTGPISVSAEGTLIYSPSPLLARLEWFDMEGRSMGKIGEPARFVSLSLAPDGARAAAVIRRGDGAGEGWICDTSRGTRTRVLEGTVDVDMVWAPTGDRIAYGGSNGRSVIYDLDGTTTEVDLCRGWPSAWSSDGSKLCISLQDAATGMDVYLIDAAGGGLQQLRANANDEYNGEFSPNGQWVAYHSDETGRHETFVISATGVGGHQQVSSTGSRPGMLWWLDDGTLLYGDASGQKLIAVTTKSVDGRIEFGAPQVTFGGRDLPSPVFSVSRDGKRLLAAVRDSKREAESLILVQNWPAAISGSR